MRCHAWVVAGLLVTAVGLGCDTGNDVPPEVLRARQIEQERQRQATTAAATKPAPTTQELLTGRKKTVRLGSFPLSLQVPESWALGSLGGSSEIMTLSGPASSGEITIQLLSPGRPVTAPAIDATFEAAKKETAAKPLPINKVDLRPLGPGKVLEQRMFSGNLVNGRPPVEIWGDVDTGVRDSNTGLNVMTKGVTNPQLIKWQLTYFHPGEKENFAVYGLKFLSLRLAEYEQDREFLEQMMGTLKYEQ